MKVRLLCSQDNDKTIRDILLGNNISISDDSKIVVAEHGFDVDVDYRCKIVFKENHIPDFEQTILSIKGNISKPDMLLGIDNGAYKPIRVNDVCYFNAINNDTFIHIANGKEYIIRKKLYQLQEDLGHNFFRINKSELVNMKKINLITPMFKGKLLLYLEGYKTPFDVSRGYTKSFKERLGL